jgi:hypothetical protein
MVILEHTLQFGDDDDNQKDTATFANSAYINKKVFRRHAQK